MVFCLFGELKMKNFSFVFGVIALALFVSFLLSYPVMLLWNECLVPAVTILREVSWLQMWGISVLFAILFKVNYTSSKN
jgi:hypothetical protein